MRLLLSIIALPVFVSSVLLSHADAKDTTSILLFGDSIVAGYGLKASDTIPKRLEEALQDYDVEVINGGVSGDTTSGGKNRLEWTLDTYKPDIVVLALGGNDVLRGIHPAMVRSNVKAMLDMLKKRNITTILSGVQAPENLGKSYPKQINDVYEGLAKEYHVPLYPFLITNTYGKAGLMQGDRIHPTAKGATLIAAELAGYLIDRKYIK